MSEISANTIRVFQHVDRQGVFLTRSRPTDVIYEALYISRDLNSV